MLREYELEIHGHVTTVQLTDEDALRRGLDPESHALGAAHGPEAQLAEAAHLKAVGDWLAAEDAHNELQARQTAAWLDAEANHIAAQNAEAAKTASEAEKAATAAANKARSPRNKAQGGN